MWLGFGFGGGRLHDDRRDRGDHAGLDAGRRRRWRRPTATSTWLQRDLDYKRAHAAAQAGIADYSFHLNNDNSYWARCTEVPEPNAVNQQGSTARRGASCPARRCRIRDRTAARDEQIDNAKPPNRSNRCSSRAVPTPAPSASARPATPATPKPRWSRPTSGRACSTTSTSPSYETLDPVTYWTQTMINGAYTQCTKFYREGRSARTSPAPRRNCIEINFISGDNIKGPLHTNDELLICGTPKFGRSAADVIEVGAPPQGWIAANARTARATPTRNSSARSSPPRRC